MVSPYHIARICTANSYKFAPRSGRGVKWVGARGRAKGASAAPTALRPGVEGICSNFVKIQDIYFYIIKKIKIFSYLLKIYSPPCHPRGRPLKADRRIP